MLKWYAITRAAQLGYHEMRVVTLTQACDVNLDANAKA